MQTLCKQRPVSIVPCGPAPWRGPRTEPTCEQPDPSTTKFAQVTHMLTLRAAKASPKQHRAVLSPEPKKSQNGGHQAAPAARTHPDARIDRDEQDARAAAGLGRRRHEPQGGTNTGGHKQNTGRGSAMPRPLTCCPALCSTWPRGWARGSSPRTRRCHLRAVRGQVERRVWHLRRTRRSDVAAPILCRRRRSKLSRPAAARAST